MKLSRTLLALSLASLSALPAPAALVFFANEAAFDAAAPGIAVQDFSAANVPANNFFNVGNALDSTTNNGIFSTGDILPGLSISATGSNPGLDLAISGVGFSGLTNKAVLAASGVETLNLNFAPGQTAVGLGLLSEFNFSDFTLSFFSPANALLGTTVVNAVPNSGSGLFFGVLATAGDTIGRINLSSITGQVEGVDRVKFGSLVAPPAVPEPGTALAGLLALGLCASRRRRSRAAA